MANISSSRNCRCRCRTSGRRCANVVIGTLPPRNARSSGFMMSMAAQTSACGYSASICSSTRSPPPNTSSLSCTSAMRPYLSIMALPLLLVGIAVGPDHRDGLEQDPQVQPQRPVTHVGQVELDALAHRLQVVAAAIAIHLGPAGDARLDLVTHHVAGDGAPEMFVHRHGMRPRT